MAFFANLFKTSSAEEKKQSEDTMERLKKYRGKETAQWLAKQDMQAVINRAVANGGVLPSMGEAPKLEDVDKVEVDESAPYQPPVDYMYTPITAAVNKNRQLPEKNSTQVDWIESMFDEFALCARQFNGTNAEQKLMVSVNRPEYSFQTSTYDTYVTGAKISIFKGHISTHAWGMLVQGYADTIEVYVIPSDELLNATLNGIKDKGYKPFMVINSAFNNEQLEWHIENEVVSFEKIPLLAKELFRDLIRIASGKMSEEELFAGYSEGLQLGKTVAKGYAASPESAAVESTKDVSDTFGDLTAWAACRNLVAAIDKDLAQLTDAENTAEDSGNAQQLKILKEVSGDLRTLSGRLSEILSKYKNTVKV